MSTPERIQPIRGDTITLGQLIKVLSIVSSGAEVKELLMRQEILVNGLPENRRGRKLHGGDLIMFGSGERVRLQAGP